jgi:predicted NUDIX family NTP pyrophosphohydrolase
MAKQSAGILLYRRKERGLEVFLVHPGGPFWSKKDLGAWSIPKGEYTDSEDPLAAARREFLEETGFTAEGVFVSLGSVKQTGGKVVSVWALEGDCDPAQLVSNLCEIEWPPRSGRKIEIPEVDRGGWFQLGEAHQRILASQSPMLLRLAESVDHRPFRTQ